MDGDGGDGVRKVRGGGSHQALRGPFQEAGSGGGIGVGGCEEVGGSLDRGQELVDSSWKKLKGRLAPYENNDWTLNSNDPPRGRYEDGGDGNYRLGNKDRDGGLNGGENDGAAEYLWKCDSVSYQSIGKTIHHTWSLAQSMEGLRLAMLMQSRGPKWWDVQTSPCRRWCMSRDWTRTEMSKVVAAAVVVAAQEILYGCVHYMTQGIYNLEDSFGVAVDEEYGCRSNNLLQTSGCSCMLKDDGAGRYLREMCPSQPEMAPAL